MTLPHPSSVHLLFHGDLDLPKAITGLRALSHVLATKDGSLKTFGAGDKPPVWRHADKSTELTVLDLSEPATRTMIYRDFAIYGALGTPCD